MITQLVEQRTVDLMHVGILRPLVLLLLEGGASVAWGLPGGTSGKVPMQETQVKSLSQEDPLEEAWSVFSSILTWRFLAGSSRRVTNSQTQLKPSSMHAPAILIWASLMVQTVKNLPAMWETHVRPLGWEDPEKEIVTHSSILA